MDKERSENELEFRRAEFELFMRRYGLEDLEDVLSWVQIEMKNMISKGEVPATEAGVMKAMSRIVNEHPEVDAYLRKFVKAADKEKLSRIKQAKRPN